jgi:hypothetical protein
MPTCSTHAPSGIGVTEELDGVEAGSGAGAVLTDSVGFLVEVGALVAGFVSGTAAASFFGSRAGSGTVAVSGLFRPESGAVNAGGSVALGVEGTEELATGGGVGVLGSSFSQARRPMAKAARMEWVDRFDIVCKGTKRAACCREVAQASILFS